VADRPNVLPTWVFTQPLRRFGILRQTAHASASLGMRVLKRWALRCLTVFLIFLAPVCPLSPSSVILIMHCAWVYFLTNKRHTILYVGVTNNLATRLWEHRSKKNPKCFTAHSPLSWRLLLGQRLSKENQENGTRYWLKNESGME